MMLTQDWYCDYQSVAVLIVNNQDTDTKLKAAVSKCQKFGTQASSQDPGSILHMAWPADGHSRWMSVWYLQALTPSRSLHPDNVSDMPGDETWAGPPFSAPLDRESCWQTAAERQRSAWASEVQQTLKGQNKQFQVQQQGPSRNYWRRNVLLIMIHAEFSPFPASFYGSSCGWHHQHAGLYIRNETTSRFNYQ